MGTAVYLVPHEEDFNRGANVNSIILNDLDDTSINEKERINEIIYTVSGDVFSNIPSCECGRLNGAYNLGLECNSCQTKVTKKLEGDLDPLVWIRAPEGVKALMNPKIWYMLNDWFTKSGFSVIRYLADTTYNPTLKDTNWYDKILAELHANNITGRGWNYFHDNFDIIMEVLFRIPSVRKTSKKLQDYLPLRDLLLRDRRYVFTQYLPMPNRSLLVIEANESGRWRDKNIDGVIDAMRLMTGIDIPSHQYTIRKKESRTVKTIDALSQYYSNFERSNSPKEGIWRKHVMGSRCNFAARTVISSITKPHDYYELHIPWGVAVSMLRYHILNKLFKKGFSAVKAFNYLNRYALEYDDLLNEIFKELISESPFPGIPVIHTRNPVLGAGSTQLCYITEVKTDVNDNTTGTSIMIVVPWNLDFETKSVSYFRKTKIGEHYVRKGRFSRVTSRIRMELHRQI